MGAVAMRDNSSKEAGLLIYQLSVHHWLRTFPRAITNMLINRLSLSGTLTHTYLSRLPRNKVQCTMWYIKALKKTIIHVEGKAFVMQRGMLRVFKWHINSACYIKPTVNKLMIHIFKKLQFSCMCACLSTEIQL